MQNLSCENDFFIIMQIKLIPQKGFELGLVLRVRVFWNSEWPILFLHAGFMVRHFYLSVRLYIQLAFTMRYFFFFTKIYKKK